MQAIIMAAGKGTRLQDMTKELPKPLVPVRGIPMLGRKLNNLLKVRGISEIIVVTGYLGEQIENYVRTNYPNERIRLVRNDEYNKGSVITLLKAAPYIKQGFLLLNADHLFSAKAYRKVVRDAKGVMICSFRNRKPFDDEMKIKYHDNGHVEMSKKHETYDCGYTGLTAVGNDAYQDYLKIAREKLQLMGENIVPENLILPLCENGVPVNDYDLSAHSFVEVDTPEDFVIAHHRIKLIEAEDE